MQIDISPSAARLTESLRDLGYDFDAAVADLVDNSVEAGATRVDIVLRWDDTNPWIRISDNGTGMTPAILDEAIRFGTRKTYSENGLGRYGLGLKTATFSQCRRLMIASRAAKERRWIHSRSVDLDTLSATDLWAAHPIPHEDLSARLIDPLENEPGTVVIWEKLDRVFQGVSHSGWARRRLLGRAESLHSHLGMVFHRFIAGTIPKGETLKITVNGDIVQAWDPFALSERSTLHLPKRRIAVRTADIHGEVTFLPYVLPHREAFSTPRGFERFAGPNKWNRQQGLYIYRSNRLVQSGGWAGIRAIDEHTKFARAALDFGSKLDSLFNVNVAKMRVSIPQGVREQLSKPISDLVRVAQNRYRRGEYSRSRLHPPTASSRADLHDVGLAIRAAAMSTNRSAAMRDVAEKLTQSAPDLARQLGWDS